MNPRTAKLLNEMQQLVDQAALDRKIPTLFRVGPAQMTMLADYSIRPDKNRMWGFNLELGCDGVMLETM